jgi:quinol monooxygenase YgiN
MLVIGGWLKLAAGEFDKVKDQAGATVAATNQEDGCLHYSYARDIDDPDLIHIFERWRDQAALDGHSASLHVAAFGKAMAGVKREGAEIWLYSAEEVRKLM